MNLDYAAWSHARLGSGHRDGSAGRRDRDHDNCRRRTPHSFPTLAARQSSFQPASRTQHLRPACPRLRSRLIRFRTPPSRHFGPDWVAIRSAPVRSPLSSGASRSFSPAMRTTGAPRPKLEQFIYRINPDDNTQLVQLQTGETQMAAGSGSVGSARLDEVLGFRHGRCLRATEHGLESPRPQARRFPAHHQGSPGARLTPLRPRTSSTTS